MTDQLLYWITAYGTLFIAVATFLSCFAIPMPSSLAMLAGGAFAASGDLSLFSVSSAAFLGAILGDQSGYWLGRTGGAGIWARLRARPKTTKLIERAERSLHAQAIPTVYLSTWLFSPLGPYVNFLAGATRIGWLRFTLADSAGEATWVAVYVGLGYGFGSQIETLSGLLGNTVGALTAGLIALLLGRVLWRSRKDP